MNNMKLRVCLTDKCNFECTYCREGGEAGLLTSDYMEKEQLVDLLKKLNLCGFEALRFTGGEPLLRKDWYDIINEVSKQKIYKKITMVTNGSLLLLNNNIEKIKEIGFKSVTVSLDSLNEEVFQKITKRNNLKIILEGILKLKAEGINVKINSVISKINYNEAFDIIEFCNENKINLKMLDLVGMDSAYWKKEYISLLGIEEKLEEVCEYKYIQYQDEGFGTPEHVYKYKDIEVVIKNSNLGTCYIASCKDCRKYPCQSGIVSMILSHDGLLKICSLKEDEIVDIKGLVNDEQEIKEQIKNIIEVYNSAQFFQSEWKDGNNMNKQ